MIVGRRCSRALWDTGSLVKDEKDIVKSNHPRICHERAGKIKEADGIIKKENGNTYGGDLISEERWANNKVEPEVGMQLFCGSENNEDWSMGVIWVIRDAGFCLFKH